MKQLNTYITEKLVLNKYSSSYNFYPENKEELQKILKELLTKGETNLNCIDVSKITDMDALFYDLHLPDGYIKNIDISEWNVSNVKTMKRMFLNYELFNADLSSWDVSNVTSMWGMFYKCKRFTGEGLEKWDVSSVTNMKQMFQECDTFNCDISSWDVSNVTDMMGMFMYCEKFNKDLSSWTIYKNTDTHWMFKDCKSLKKLPSWYNE